MSTSVNAMASCIQTENIEVHRLGHSTFRILELRMAVVLPVVTKITKHILNTDLQVVNLELSRACPLFEL